MKAIILKFSAVLLAGFLFSFWLQFFAPFDLPEYVPNTPIRIAGLLMFVIVMPVFISSMKALLRKDETLSIGKLSLYGILIFLIAETIFQSLRQLTFHSYTLAERIQYFLMGTIGTTILMAFISFFIAYQLKTRNTGKLVLMIVVFLVIVKIIQYFVPALGAD